MENNCVICVQGKNTIGSGSNKGGNVSMSHASMGGTPPLLVFVLPDTSTTQTIQIYA